MPAARLLLPALALAGVARAFGGEELAALQAVLGAQSHSEDYYEALREALAVARDAGVNASEVGEAETRLKVLAVAELDAAVKEGTDLERLLDAIQRSRLDGVPSMQAWSAERLRDSLLGKELTEALAADDIRQLCRFLSLADSHGGASLAANVSSARAQLQAKLADALANAGGLVDTDRPRLQAAADCGLAEGANATSVAAAKELLESAKRKAQAREEIEQARAEKDWWGLLVAVAEARKCGVPNTELMSPVAQYMSMARAQVLAAANESAPLDEVEAALQLGEAASLSDKELVALRARLARAEKEQVQVAEAAEDLRKLKSALLAAIHVDNVELAAAEAKLPVLLSSKMKAAASQADSGKPEELTDLLDFALHGNVPHDSEETQQVAKRYITSLEQELQEASQAASTERLDKAMSLASACDDCLNLALGDNATAHEEYGRIYTSAGAVREREWSKAVVMEELQEATSARNPPAMREAIDKAKAAGVPLMQLMHYDSQMRSVEAMQTAIREKLAAAAAAKSKESLALAIKQGEIAGLDQVHAHDMLSARAALNSL